MSGDEPNSSSITLDKLRELVAELPPLPGREIVFWDGQHYSVDRKLFEMPKHEPEFLKPAPESFKVLFKIAAPIVMANAITAVIACAGDGSISRRKPLPRGKRRRAMNRWLRARGLGTLGGIEKGPLPWWPR